MRHLTPRILLCAVLGLWVISGSVQADRTTSYTYTLQGQIETIDGPRLDVSDITTYAYDAKGNRNLVRNALGHETQTTAFDGTGRPLTIVDPNGLTTQLNYDPRGRLLGQDITDGIDTHTTTYVYDPAGNLIQVSSPGGSVLHYEYDAANRLIGLQDDIGNRIDYTLDAIGNHLETRVSDPAGILTKLQSQVYNQLGRLIQSIDAQDRATKYAYDANGNLTETTDARQNPTHQVYDALDRLQQTTDALDGITHYTYDTQDNLTSITDPNGLTTRYEYDGLGNLITQTSPDTGITSYTYDEAGNRLTQTDARGIVVNYEYDALNRLTTVRYSDSSLDVSYVYDQGISGIGRLTRMTDAQGATDYTYNAFGQLVSRSRTSNDDIVTIFRYEYDPNGLLSRMTYPSGQAIQYGYDAQGQLDNLSLLKADGSAQSLVSNIRRLPFGPIQAYDYGNGLNLERSFDLDYRLIGQAIPGILQSSYLHDLAGNITDWLDLLSTGRDQQFGYDKLDRLISASGAYGVLGYTYDATSNRLSLTNGADTQTYTYATNSHRLLEILGTNTDSRDYDAIGNTLISLFGSYSYDTSNRMVSFTKSGVTATYAYNGLGERIRKSVNGVITRFRYGAKGQLLGEYTASGMPIREYVYLGDSPVALLQGEATQVSTTLLQAVSINHVTQDISLGDHASQPIVIAGPPTYNGGQGAVTAVENVTSNSASVHIREWNYLDGAHANEEVSLLALPPGRYPQADGSVWEIGSFALSGTGKWNTILFAGAFQGVPHLFLTQQTQNSVDTAIVRVRNLSADSFQTALYEQESLQNGHEEERIGYLAIHSPASGGLAHFQGRELNYQLSRISLNQNWISVGDQQLQYQEEQSKDSETGHVLESVDVLQIEGHTFAQAVTTAGGDPATIRRQGATPTQVLSGSIGGEALAYLHSDHLGAVVKATDSAQVLVWDAERKPFGERSVVTAQVEMPLGFPGQYFDEESGSYYNYFRDYDPATGRYLQSDPIGLGGGINTYVYVSGNPVRFTDSLGLQVDSCWLVRDYVHNFICKDNNCAGLLPWPDSGAGGCPNKGQVVGEIKDDAFFCSEVDSGKDQCEQETFEKCVEENINRKNGYPGSCDSYDFFGGRNCISWRNEVIEQCRQVSKWSCM